MKTASNNEHASISEGCSVDREEFKRLRKLPGKEISADIEFVKTKEYDENVLVFDKATVANSIGLEIMLNGTYDKRTKTTIFNFVLHGVGPICRVCVNGQRHRDAGRTHKHELEHESDPRKSLPHAVARPDFVNKSPREIWEILCRQAKIEHTGNFVDPI